MNRLHPSKIHGSHYYPLLKIALTWLAGLAFAVGHHFFYTYLNNRVVTTSSAFDFHWKNAAQVVHSQAGASAIGTAFAYLVSGFLSVSAGIAFVQCAWKLVRQRSFTVAGLDALWSSQTNALAFTEVDFWRGARAVVFVAGLAWAFPLVVTFAPGTLSVVNQGVTSSVVCNVPTFDFTASAAFYEIIHSAAVPYSGPTSLANRVVGATLLGGQPFTPGSSPCQGNCTYLLSINAPSFNCTTGALNTTALNWNTTEVPLSYPPPYVGKTFNAAQPAYQYTNWDFEVHYQDYSRFFPLSGSMNNATCIAYNSTYHLNYTFFGSTPSVTIDQIVQDKPASQLFQNTTDGSDPAFVPGSFVHSAWFNATTNYYALFSSLYTYIGGGNITIEQTGNSISFVSTPPTLSVTDTHLVYNLDGSFGNLTWNDLPGEMESLLQNITLSLLTLKLDSPATALTPATCITFNTLPHFAYNAHRLFLVYGIGLACALLCDFVGVAALFQNEFGARGGFSDFLAATRNSELSEIDLKRPVKLKYGPLRRAGGRFGFGKPESLLEGGEPSQSSTSESFKDIMEKGEGNLPLLK